MEFLDKIKLITPLTENAYRMAQSGIEQFQFKKNQVLLRKGMVCNYLYFIRSGMMRGFYHTSKKEITNSIATEGDIITSYYSFITRKPSYETLECLEESTVQAISYQKLNELYAHFPETERAGRLVLEDYYARLEERVISIQFKSAKERYDLLYQSRPALMHRAPLGCIASYLGITQETLSRIRAGN